MWIAASGWQHLSIESGTALNAVTAQLSQNSIGGFSAEPLRMLALGVAFLLVARYGRKGV